MRVVRWTGVTLALVLAPALLGGCGPAGSDARGPATESSTPAPASSAEPGGASSATSPPPTDPGLPSLEPPSGAPRTPTDLVPSDIVVGTIRADRGSCYTLETDDGVQYALVGGDGRPLAPGVVVRVKVAEDRAATPTCPGRPVTIIDLEVV